MAQYTPAELARMRADYDALVNSSTRLTQQQRDQLDLLRQTLTAVGGLSQDLQDQVEAQERIVETLKARAELDAGSAQRSVRRQAALQAESDLINIQMEQLKAKAILEGQLSDDEEKRLAALEEAIELQNILNTALEENEQLVKSIGSSFDQNVMKSVMRITDMIGRPMEEKLRALNNSVNNLADAGFGKLFNVIKEMVFKFDELSSAFERQFGLGEDYTNAVNEQYKALNNYGVSLSEAFEAQGTLIQGVTDFTMISQRQRDVLAENSAILGELGVANQDFARGVQGSIKFFGQSAEEAAVTQREIAATARALGRAPGELSAEFAAAGPALAKFGDQGVKAFKDLSRVAKITGMEMDKVLSITNRFDTFEGAAEQAGQLNAALGGNFVNAMDLMTATDPVERFEMIRDSILDAGLSFDDMSYYQKQFYTEALGLSEVGDLALMLSGNMDELGGAANKTADQLLEERKRAQEVQTAQENLAIVGQDLVENFMKPAAEALRTLGQTMVEYSTAIKVFVGIAAGYKAIMMALSIQKAILTVTTGSLAAAEAAQAANGKRAALTLGLIGLAVAALAMYLMIASPSKVVLAMFGLAAGIYAITKIGPTGVANLQALAVPLMQIGASVFLVAAGLALVAGAFSLLSTSQMVGLGVALLMVAGAVALMGLYGVAAAPGVIAVGLALSTFVGPALAFGAAVFMIGSGIGIAAAGMAAMFESIDTEKMAAFLPFLSLLAASAVPLLVASAGFTYLGVGLGVMATSLAFIKTADLEAIAQFATGMAEIQVDQVIALADAIREVADAMTEVPTVKAIALTATMQTAAVASQAAQILAGQRPQERAGTNAQATVANNNNQSTRPIDVNITLELDGDVLDRRIVRVNKNSQSSGGPLSAIEQILG